MPGQLGRPQRKSRRLPYLGTVVTDSATDWTPRQQRWSDDTVCQRQYLSSSAVWCHAGQPPVSPRNMVRQDPGRCQEPQTLVSPDTALVPREPDLITAPLFHGSDFSWRGDKVSEVPLGHSAQQPGPCGASSAGRHSRRGPTFSDELAFLRRTLWGHSPLFCMRPFLTYRQKLAPCPPSEIMEVLCFFT